MLVRIGKLLWVEILDDVSISGVKCGIIKNFFVLKEKKSISF